MDQNKLKCSKYVEADEMSSLDYEIMIDESGSEMVHFCSDIDYLIGLKSVEHLDPVMIQNLSVMHEGQPLPKGVSDDDLIKFCKPRYIQEPSDCEKWYDVLKNYAEGFVESKKHEVQEYIDSHSEEFNNQDNSDD